MTPKMLKPKTINSEPANRVQISPPTRVKIFPANADKIPKTVIATASPEIKQIIFSVVFLVSFSSSTPLYAIIKGKTASEHGVIELIMPAKNEKISAVPPKFPLFKF